MDNIFHSLVSTYCFSDDEHFSLKETDMNLLSVSGYTNAEISDKFQNELYWMILPEDRHLLSKALEQPCSKNEPAEVSFRIRHKTGRVVLTMNKLCRITLDDQTECFYCVMMDITKSKEYQYNTNKALEQYQIILSQTKNVTFELDVTTDTISFSERWADFFGYTPSTTNFIAKLPANPHIHPADVPSVLQNLREIKTGASYKSMDIRLSTGGQFVWFCLRATAIRDAQDKLVKIIGILLNIDDQKKVSSELQARAECDSLTKLLNKETMKSQSELYLNSYPNGSYCALMVIDLDNFKYINDHYGHIFGDTVIVKAAEAIKTSFRSRDLVGRIGGDEFMVLMKDISNQDLVKERCTKMLSAFQTLLAAENVDHTISCSIGVALSPYHGTTYEKLFKYADEAMYQAKNNGKNNFAIYNPGILYY